MHFFKSQWMVFLVLWIMGGSIFAQSNTFVQSGVYGQSGVVADIVVSGLKRTKPLVAERILEKFRGLRPDEINENDVRAAIIESGVLDPERIEFLPHDEDENWTLRAVVVEKMTFFPVPLFMVGSDGWAAGLALADMNAFGLRDTLALAGFYSGDSWFVMAMYSHTGVVAAKPGFMFGGTYSRSEFKVNNAYGVNLLSMERTDIGASVGIRWQFSETWGGRLTLGYDQSDIEALDRTDRTITARPEIGVHRSSWDGYLLNQNSAALEYAIPFSLDGLHHQVTAGFTYDQSIISGFRFSAKGGAVWMPEADVFTETTPNVVNTSIMTNNFRATNMAGLYAGLEKALFRINAGTLSLLAAYQVLAAQSLSDGGSFDHGPFAGIQFYLRRLAIPAVGLGYTYNLVRDTSQWSFSIGMRF
jgi:hypothetical protein